MGDPKKKRKKFEKPKRLWDKERLEEDKKLKGEYGLKNMRELWKLQTMIRKKRQNARKLLALAVEDRAKRETELLNSLIRMGVLSEGVMLDDVLALTVRELLERRLQTIVLRKNLANTITQARQFVTHGHIAVKNGKVNRPGYLVSKQEEESVSWSGKPIELAVKPVKSKEDLKKAFEEAEKAEMQAEKSSEEEQSEKEEKIRGNEKKEEPKEESGIKKRKEKKTGKGKEKEKQKEKEESKEKKKRN